MVFDPNAWIQQGGMAFTDWVMGKKDVNREAIGRFFYELSKWGPSIRAIAGALPGIGKALDIPYDAAQAVEMQKWVNDWHKKTGLAMKYPLLTKAGQVPHLRESLAEQINGALYRPPKKAVRRL